MALFRRGGGSGCDRPEPDPSEVYGPEGKERVRCRECATVYNLSTVNWENVCEHLKAERAHAAAPEGGQP